MACLHCCRFSTFFRGTPHQLAAIKQLEESMPEGLLEEDADWFQAWKESGYDQQVYMPYFTQLDNKTGTGYRECFSSASAMVAAFYKKVTTDDEYNEIRAKFGDTTSVEAQLGSVAQPWVCRLSFRKDGNADMVELEIENGRPVLVGWLHAGNMLLGEPPMCSGLGLRPLGGHWLCRQENSDDPFWIMQDPRGYPEMEKGGWSNPHQRSQCQGQAGCFYQRWQAEGPGTGWVILWVISIGFGPSVLFGPALRPQMLTTGWCLGSETPWTCTKTVLTIRKERFCNNPMGWATGCRSSPPTEELLRLNAALETSKTATTRSS